MKKRFNILISLFLCVLCIMLFSFTIGCGGSDGSGNSDSGSSGSGSSGGGSSFIVKDDPYAISAYNVFENGFYVLADFETYGETIQALGMYSLGKITMIEEHATRGKHAIRIDIDGTENWSGHTNPCLSFITNGQYFQKLDFTDCDYLLIDMFNPTNNNIKMGFGINTGYPQEYFTLVPGKNDVRIDLDSKYADKLSLVNTFDFIFDRGELHPEKEIVYMDNFRAHKSK